MNSKIKEYFEIKRIVSSAASQAERSRWQSLFLQ